MTDAPRAHEREHEPLPECGTLIGLLHVLRKAHGELAGEHEARRRFSEVSTRADAKRYIDELMPHLLNARAARRQASGRASAAVRDPKDPR
jgi:hypothetical protein